MTASTKISESEAVAAGPAPPATSQRSLDDVVADLNNHPFFMTTYDNTNRANTFSDDRGSSERDDADPRSQRTNPYLDALKELAYEGTPTEVAENFKSQGNECAREKRWADAREFYDKALTYISQKDKPQTTNGKHEPEVDWVKSDSSDDDRHREVTDIEEEQKMLKQIEEACWVNRGLCSLELSKFSKRHTHYAMAVIIQESNSDRAFLRRKLSFGNQ